MKSIAFSLAFLLLAGPAWSQDMPGGYGGGGGDGSGGYKGEMRGAQVPDGSELVTSHDRGDPVGVAEEQRLQGRCDKAMPTLRRFAERGRGSEIAQFNLGLCQFDLAKAEPDAKRAADLRKEGAQWIVQSADGGFGKAQAEAVTIYLDATGVAGDPVEAEKWALLYHDNGTRLAIGMADIASDLRDRLDAVLTGTMRADAQARADAWTKSMQSQDQ